MSERIAEVIEASSTEFIAQCDELHTPPPLGSLLAVSEGDIRIYALVAYAETTSIEPGRQPVARGAGLAQQEEVYRQHPELTQLLRTSFSATVVGHRSGDRNFPYLPPYPARIHAFVHPVDPDEARDFSRDLSFLPTLLHSSMPTGDEFVSASLRSLAASHHDPQSFLVETGRQIALHLRGDTTRLQTLLHRMRV